jgi:acetyltransferase
MSVCNLDYLFQPESVADHGASDRPQSIAATVMRNLFSGECEVLAQFGGQPRPR